MATLKDIRKRITSVRNTQQITKAMKMVAASKLRRAQADIESARPYSEKLRKFIARILANQPTDSSTSEESSKNKKAVVLIINSDKGLCAGLNNNLNKHVSGKLINIQKDYEEVRLAFFGRKAKEFFSRSNYPNYCTNVDLSDEEYKQRIQATASSLVDEFAAGKVQAFYLAFNRFQSVIQSEPTFIDLFSVDPEEETGESKDSPEHEESVDYIFEPSREKLLEKLIEKSVVNQAYTALLDNMASEHAARMTAMDAATNNAKEVIEKLQLQYNRARQASITKELIEIISGAEAIH